jgi:predicted secreted protein
MNKKRLIVAWVMIILIGLIASFCSAKDLQDFDNHAEVMIDTVARKCFIITLESNKTTGYEWQLAEPLDNSMLRFISSKYVTGDSDLVGAGGKEEWTFMALKPGKTAVSLKYVRSWEKDAPPAKKIIFVVVIRGK